MTSLVNRDMTCVFAAYFMPCLLGLILPFLLNNSNLSWRKLFINLSILWGGFVLVLLILNLVNSPALLTTWKFLGLILFLTGWGVMIGTVVYFLRRLCSGKLSQLIVSLLVALMIGTVFYANCLIEVVRYNLVLRQLVIKLFLAFNPMLVIAGNFFSHDLLRGRQLYYLSDIGPFYSYTYPLWSTVLGVYVIISLICLGLGRVLRPKTEP